MERYIADLKSHKKHDSKVSAGCMIVNLHQAALTMISISSKSRALLPQVLSVSLHVLSAEARNSIGLVLVGGMAVGTFFTLFVISSIEMLIAREKNEAISEVAAESQANLSPAPQAAGHSA
jgi:hypothetical protein